MLTAKLKACFLYARTLLWVNLPFSFFVALMGGASGWGFWKTFSISLVTGGTLLSSYFFERQRGAEYYFYYNLGIPKGALYASAFVFNLVLGIVVLIVKNAIQ